MLLNSILFIYTLKYYKKNYILYIYNSDKLNFVEVNEMQRNNLKLNLKYI